MNRNFFIDTERIRCQPFIKDDIDSFNGIIKVDPEVRRFFTFGSLLSFFVRLHEYDCCPMVVYRHLPGMSTIDSQMIGYINGYDYGNSEMLVEFFVAKDFRRNKYAAEMVHAPIICAFLATSLSGFTLRKRTPPVLLLWSILALFTASTKTLKMKKFPERRASTACTSSP